MTCPFCERAGERRELHAHMLSDHRDRLVTRSEEGRIFMEVNCPTCSEGISKEVNPRGRDPEFLDKFADEIRMVGFDLLLYHWETHVAAAVEGPTEG
jgi:hypothetical protein